MYLIEVSPTKHLGNLRGLTYFSKHEYKKGDLIKVSVRNSQIYAFVTHVKPLKEVKADVKDKSYMPKKVRKQDVPEILSDTFKKAVLKTALLYAVPEGLLLSQLMPSGTLKNPDKLFAKMQTYATVKKQEQEAQNRTRFSLIATNKDLPDRIELYKANIREKLARKQNVVLIAPNQEKAQSICATLKSGIKKMIECYDSTASQNKLFSQIAELSAKNTPFCIVGSSHVLSLPIKNIGLYILEEQNNPGYIRQGFPFTNVKKFAENLAKEAGVELLLGDTFLDLDIYKRALADEANIIDGIPRKIRTNKEINLVNVKEEINEAKELKLDYPFVGKEVLLQIQAATAKSESSFVFVPKRGLASQISCKDCGSTVKCVKCALNMKLHSRKNSGNYLLCHRCGYTQEANITCPTCNGWNLIQLGITSEVVANYIQNKTKIKCVTINSKTDRKILQNMASGKSEHNVTVGTSVGLNIFKPRQFEHVFAVGLDGLMAVPDFQIEEKIFGNLMKLLEIADKSLSVQIKDDTVQAINLFAKRSINEFIRQELKLREQLIWPPYSVLVKITAKGTKKQIIDQMQILVNELGGYNLRVFRAFAGSKNNRELSALIKIPNGNWPDNNLIEILKLLPSSMEFRVFPEEVL